MIKLIMRRFALSRNGAESFIKGVLWTTVMNIVLMFPAVYLFLFLDERLHPLADKAAMANHGALYYGAMGLAMMIVMYIIGVLQYRSTYTSVYDESATRRISLAEKLRRLPLAFFGERNLSDLTSTIMDDCTDLEHTFSHAVPQLFASLLSLLFIATGMFFYHWQMALALFWPVPVSIAVLLISKYKMRQNNRRDYLNKRAASEVIQEGLDTMQELKACCREAEYMSKLNKMLDRYEQELIKGEALTGIFVHGAQSILRLGLASVIITGALLLQKGDSTVFTYLVFLVIGARVYAPVHEVLNNLAALFHLDIRINRMNEMELMPVQTGAQKMHTQGYDITFEHVSFAYEAEKQVLKDVSFTARQGEITALIGPSGGGKSTAAKLAARFWDVDRGRITIGGVDVKGTEPETLLRNFAIVFQDVVLFNASIIDNIRIGKRTATDEEVLNVARKACCDEFVSRLPDGYNTVIGENGQTLSGGERQRISIARALLKDAPIVLLDEATASLDVEHETLVQTGLSALVRGKTVLIIAHRMRTIAEADKILVLEGGTITEQGRPKELKQRNGYFKRMLTMQQQ